MLTEQLNTVSSVSSMMKKFFVGVVEAVELYILVVVDFADFGQN